MTDIDRLAREEYDAANEYRIASAMFYDARASGKSEDHLANLRLVMEQAAKRLNEALAALRQAEQAARR